MITLEQFGHPIYDTIKGPAISLLGHSFNLADITRFLRSIIAGPNCCNISTLPQGGKGYPRLSLGRTHKFRCHRIAYALWQGPIPEGLMVCHTCDNRRCVNPNHLFIGDAYDNNTDMQQKGRANIQTQYKRKYDHLVPEMLRLRKEGRTQAAIATLLGISQHAVSSYLNRTKL